MFLLVGLCCCCCCEPTPISRHICFLYVSSYIIIILCVCHCVLFASLLSYIEREFHLCEYLPYTLSVSIFRRTSERCRYPNMYCLRLVLWIFVHTTLVMFMYIPSFIYSLLYGLYGFACCCIMI